MSIAASASCATVYDLFCAQALHRPNFPALKCGSEQISYHDALAKVDAAAADLRQRLVARGDRVAVIAENSIGYTLVQLACAKVGAIIACQNWRLSRPQLKYCIDLVSPRLILSSPRFFDKSCDDLGSEYAIVSLEDVLAAPELKGTDPCVAEPEDGLIIIYTSGTTGLPKAALISHRAEIARMCVLRLDLGITRDDAYLAWSPMFHMGGTEHTLATLMSGGLAIITDGFDVDAIIDAIVDHHLGWLLLVPATIERLLDRMRERGVKAQGIRAVGCMADLVPSALISELTGYLDAPYFNSFGSTETGLPPLSSDLIPVGTELPSFPKRLSTLCEFRLVDMNGVEARHGEVGEGVMRGPTLFSGYWNAEDVTRDCFRSGWYHMGDLFQQLPDQTYVFVGREKYLIKSGGENIYPAEIERILLADARVLEAVVVRKLDPKWGEVPVVCIARTSEDFTESEVLNLCEQELASYKWPKEIIFLPLSEFPRNLNGKILREEIEHKFI